MKGRDICFLTAAFFLLLSSCEEQPDCIAGGRMNVYRTDSFADVLLYVDAVNEHGVESLALPVDHAPKYCPEGYSGPIFEVRIGLGQGDEDALCGSTLSAKGRRSGSSTTGSSGCSPSIKTWREGILASS